MGPGGAVGWSYRELLPYFKKSEGLVASDEINSGEIDVDADAHNTAGPLGVSVRAGVEGRRDNSSRRPWPRASPAATTTAATG